MKTNDRKSLHGKSLVELTKELKLKQNELVNRGRERFEKQVKNTRGVRELRDDVARIQTVINQLLRQEKKS